ncbi:membrane protein [Nitrospira sp. KM1]|uniref:PepSY-associated TM helix domain-containing protein n=1 Tax=Nitrospira sp. KM1 TaxID=1936990 RepID=UPI0013A7795F|nr:PepSY-associated TM helix domain-containing protein [Nitrospira sp. KM1]BCA56629.1 membrane protein [Nitrospira sp. KM1]
MKDSFSQSMDWLHTWGGLLFGWLLFAIFLTGTLTVFDKDITYWMRPELHALTPSTPNVEAAANQLSKLGVHADEWWIEFPHVRDPAFTIYWEDKGAGTMEERHLDPATGDVLRVRGTRGGDFFYRFHYQLHLDRPGIWIVGASAMAMLTALVTGLVIHRRIFKDFFTFRPRATPHRAWLDAHNVTSILVLPFHLIITFTGLVIFWNTYMPAGVDLLYEGKPELAYKDVERRMEREPANVQASLGSLVDADRRARTYWRGGNTEWLGVKHPGDRHALVEVTRRADDRLALISDRVTFDGVTGEVLQVWTDNRPAFLTYSVLIGLHYLWFDHMAIRWLYFFMGLSATVMIGTGLMLWIVKRRDCHTGYRRGFQIVEGLNIAVLAGLPVAIAVFFWGNRLLPVDVADRALWEMRLFFLAWSLCAVYSFTQQDALGLWKRLLHISGLLFVLLPVLNMVTTESHVVQSLADHNWRLAGVDLVSLGVGSILCWTAWRISRPSREAVAHSTDSLVNAGQV